MITGHKFINYEFINYRVLFHARFLLRHRFESGSQGCKLKRKIFSTFFHSLKFETSFHSFAFFVGFLKAFERECSKNAFGDENHV